jgi:regulatory protein
MIMPVISRISVQKHNKERYSVFIDSGKGEEYAFSVDEDVLIKYQLKKGIELDDLSVTEMLYQDDIRKAYNLAVNYLARRMRSEEEVREHLRQKEVDETVVQEVIHRLYEYKFLNDQEFSRAFVRTQMNSADKGPELIKTELKKKGLKENIITEAMAEYPLEAQVEKAAYLGSKFAAKNSRDSSKILKQKLEQHLLRKGSPFQVITIAMEDIIVEKQEDLEMDALKYQGEKLMKKHAKLTGPEFSRKMKQGLFNKGFSLDLIEKYLNSLEPE